MKSKAICRYMPLFRLAELQDMNYDCLNFGIAIPLLRDRQGGKMVHTLHPPCRNHSGLAYKIAS